MGRGRYLEQLARYGNYFARSQMHVLSSESLFGDARRVVGEVFGFLGLGADTAIGDVSARNVAPNRAAVSGEVRARLDRYFEPHNRALFSWLGRSFDW